MTDQTLDTATVPFCHRLGTDWEGLAITLQIPSWDRHQFSLGRECFAILDWLQSRDKLGRLIDALPAIDRKDLLDLAREIVNQGNIDTDPHEDSNALEYVRAASNNYAVDAALLEQIIATDDQEESVTLADLYVPRAGEKIILERLAQGDVPMLLVAGEAGSGKTSLLWGLHRSLTPPWDPWFINATLLGGGNLTKTGSQALPEPHIALLTQAAQASEREKRRPVLLLDTADLLLHNERDRLVLTLLLDQWQNHDWVIVITCRPHEANFLHKRSALELIPWPTLYDIDNELPQVVKKYTQRYCQCIQSLDVEQETARLMAALSTGYSMQLICRHPLTLRMLFSLYSPMEISKLEINVFDLYRQFWDDRVRMDKRGGQAYPTQAQMENLEKTASGIALAMLSDGRTELIVDYLEIPELSKHDLARQQDAMVSRGVLRRLARTHVQFFHQTFFEHAAARALLIYGKEEGLTALAERFQLRPTDAYLRPVMEHTLLLAEHWPNRKVRRCGDHFLMHFLEKGDHLVEKTSIYVYCHRRAVTRKMQRAVGKRFADNRENISDYLKYLPNMHGKRMPDVEIDIQKIWEVKPDGNWSELDNLLGALTDIGQRSSEVAKMLGKIVDKWNLIEKILAHSSIDLSVMSRISKILFVLARHQPEWALDRILHIFFQGIQSGCFLPNKIPSTLCHRLVESSASFNAHILLTKMDDWINREKNLLDREGSQVLCQAIGAVFNHCWRKKNTQLPEILAGLTDTIGHFAYKVRINGLAEWLKNADQKSLEIALLFGFAVTDQLRRNLWITIIIGQLLQQMVQLPKEMWPSGCRYLNTFLRQHFETAWLKLSTKPSTHQHNQISPILKGLIGIMQKNLISPFTLAEIIPFDLFHSTSSWCDNNVLGKILGPAICAGHPGAIAALDVLAKKTGQQERKQVCTTLDWLARRHLDEPSTMKLFFSLYQSHGNLSIVLRGVERLEERKGNVADFLGRCHTLTPFDPGGMIRTPIGQESRTASQLIQKLLHYGIITPLPLNLLTQQVEKCHDVVARGHWLDAMRISANHYHVDEVFSVYRRYWTLKDINVRNRALSATIDLLANHPDHDPERARELIVHILEHAADAGLVKMFGRLLDALLPRRWQEATQLLEQVMTHKSMSKSDQKTRDVTSNYERILGRVFQVADQNGRQHLLTLSTKVPAHFGCKIFTAAGRDPKVYTTLSSDIQNLIQSRQVNENVCNTWFRFQENRNREQSVEWLDVISFMDIAIVSPVL